MVEICRRVWRSRYFKCCFIYATSKEWRELNPILANTSNIIGYASINELMILSNLESHNAEMIKGGKVKKK